MYFYLICFSDIGNLCSSRRIECWKSLATCGVHPFIVDEELQKEILKL